MKSRACSSRERKRKRTDRSLYGERITGCGGRTRLRSPGITNVTWYLQKRGLIIRGRVVLGPPGGLYSLARGAPLEKRSSRSGSTSTSTKHHSALFWSRARAPAVSAKPRVGRCSRAAKPGESPTAGEKRRRCGSRRAVDRVVSAFRRLRRYGAAGSTGNGCAPLHAERAAVDPWQLGG